MYLFKYRILANRDKTIFKLQIKGKIIPTLEQLSTEELPRESIAIPILVAIGLVFPIIPFILLLISGDLPSILKTFFTWETIKTTTCPLELEKLYSIHKEENQVKYPDKKLPEYTVFMKL